MSSSPAALEYCWRNTWNLEQESRDLDSGLPNLPWNEQVKGSMQMFSCCHDLLQVFSQKVKIGYYTEDNLLAPVPGAQRAVNMAVGKLRTAGYEVSYY